VHGNSWQLACANQMKITGTSQFKWHYTASHFSFYDVHKIIIFDSIDVELLSPIFQEKPCPEKLPPPSIKLKLPCKASDRQSAGDLG
jgi:hypothetical protein